MIENVYRKDKKMVSLNPPSNLFKMPKNIRQVGQVETRKKIYMEDYVMTFIRKLGEKNTNDYQVAILLGEFITIEESPNIFINGAIEIGSVSIEDKTIFNNNIWNDIYEEIKRYFTNVEVVGWIVTKAGLALEPSHLFEKIHINHFAGQDKIFLMYDSIEREEAFYIFEKNHLKRYSGYYIYYEKNVEMQNYMLAHKKEIARPEEVDDRALKEIRKRIAQKEEKKQGNNSKNFVYTLGTVAAAVVLIWGVSKLNDYEQFQGVKDVISEFSNQNNDQTVNKAEGEENTTSIETVGSNIKTIHEENVNGDIINEENKDKKENEQENTSNNIKTSQEDKENTSKETSETNDQKSNQIQSQGTSETDTNTENNNPTKETNQSDTQKVYIVKEGDSLAKISVTLYHTLDYVDELQEINKIKNKDKIVVGDKLILPK